MNTNSLFLRNINTLTLSVQNRYSIKRVMQVTAIICVILVSLQFLFLMLLPGQEKLLKTILTWRSFVLHVVVFVFMSGFFYFLTNKYYRLIIDRSRFTAYLLPSVLAVVAYCCYYYVTMILRRERFDSPEITVPIIILTTLVVACCMTGVSLLIAYLTTLRDGQKQRKVLEKQKMELEVENSQANFNFLKAQINPHFLHNTLNFFYAKALPLSAELSEGILCLSDIMRYALNEGGKDEKALLKDEIEHLENVIRINQFRFSNTLNVQFEVSGVTAGAMIVPFVLITLVENAFKHGDLKNREHPIVIRLVVEGKKLYFYCSNRKNPGFKDHSTGIGLQNILKRLDIMYGDQYSYKVDDAADYYATELIIHSL